MKKFPKTAAAIAAIAAIALGLQSPALAADDESPVVSTRLANGNEVNVFVPDVPDIGMRAAATPIFVVLGDAPMTAAEAERTAHESGLAELVAAEKGVLSFLNPVGDTWSEGDAIGFSQLLSSYADATGSPYDRRGQLCVTPPNSTEERCTYPGAISRVYVFADGRGADFVGQHVVTGIPMPLPFPDRDGNPIVPIVTPAAVWIQGASEPARNPTVEVDVPAYVFGSTADAAESYRSLNTTNGRVEINDRTSRDAFPRKEITTAYRELIGQSINRATLVQPGMQNYTIMDYAAEGVAVERIEEKVGDKDVEYFTYTPGDLPAARVPLVMAFHGGGNHAEFLMFSTKWPELAKEHGFVVAAVNGHVDVSAADVVALVDKLVADDPRLDPSRVYATGFSMGAAKTWSLAEEYPEVFAAVAPTNGAFPASTSQVSEIAVPTMYFAGLSSFLPEVPHQPCDLTACRPKAPNQIDARLQTLFAQNKVQEHWQYDETLDPVWGISPVTRSTIEDELFAGVSVEVLDLVSADGNVITRLAGVTNGHHEALPVQAEIAWEFMSRFSRGADGQVLDSTLPSSPQSVEADAEGRDVSVRWNAPDKMSGAEIVEYEVRLSDGRSTNVSGDQTTATFQTSSPGVYSATVRARNASGWSEFSEPSNDVEVREAPPIAQASLAVAGETFVGGLVSVTGAHLAPETNYVLRFEDADVEFATVRTEANGSFQVQARIPAAVKEGTRILSAVEDERTVAQVVIEITRAPVAGSSPKIESAQDREAGRLAHTGVDGSMFNVALAVGVGLIAVGAIACFCVARLRSSARRTGPDA